MESTQVEEFLLKETMILLGRHLSTLRKQKGFTISEFAKAIGKDRTTVSSYEHGRLAPSLKTLIKISIALETDIFEIFDFQYLKN